jgi:HEAT repeat protein
MLRCRLWFPRAPESRDPLPAADDAINDLIVSDKTQDPYIRSLAAQQLSNLGANGRANRVPALQSVVSDQTREPSVRASAAEALIQLGTEETASALRASSQTKP